MGYEEVEKYMRITFALLCASVLLGCGADEFRGPPGIPGPAGQDYVPAPEPESLSGYYVLENTGYLELVEDSEGRLLIVAQRIIISNPDGSFGVLPTLPTGSHFMRESKLISYPRLAFTAATHNAQSDSSSDRLTGTRQAMLEFSNNKGKLEIMVSIFSANGFVIEYTRTVRER